MHDRPPDASADPYRPETANRADSDLDLSIRVASNKEVKGSSLERVAATIAKELPDLSTPAAEQYSPDMHHFLLVPTTSAWRQAYE